VGWASWRKEMRRWSCRLRLHNLKRTFVKVIHSRYIFHLFCSGGGLGGHCELGVCV
jgi:hypothetical protein